MGRRESGNREGENVLCPLFIAFTEKELLCEPHVPEARVNVIRYGAEELCRKQRKLFCEGEWKRCEHFRSWMHWNWEDEDV